MRDKKGPGVPGPERKNMEKVSLQELTGGALQEKFDHAMDVVVGNMQDPNTPWKNKRSITIKLTFEQNEDRDDAAVSISVEKKGGAEKAGITKGSIITKFDGITIDSMATLQEQLRYFRAGEEVELVIQVPASNGEYEEQNVTVTLGKRS